MKRSIDMNKILMKGLLPGALLLLAGNAAAVDFTLATKAYDKTMPDGSTVPMWGYVIDPDNDASGRGDCYDTTPIAARAACVAALPDPLVPGPRLTVGDADTSVRIYLTNTLPEPTSLVITGQELPYSAADNGPTWDDGATGGRTSATQRVRSFGREAGANGGRRAFIWNNFRGTPFTKPGSFIYHSGTMPQKQVYMGLYGAVTKDSAPGEAYPGVAYDNEQVLFYSEIDPDLNAAIATDTLDTAIHYHARWFLVNGEPYSGACTDDGLGNDVASGYPCVNMSQTPDLPQVSAKSSTLLRFFSAAGETHVPTLQGMHMMIHAEDGNQYTWQTGDAVSGMAPREQYSIMLPPLKTKDAIIEPQLAGRYAIYDGNGYMTNPTSPDDINHADPVGGMLRFLDILDAGNAAPTAVDDVFAVVEGRTSTFDILANDTDPENTPLSVFSVGTPTSGIVSCDALGNCDYTPVGTGADSFTYEATDGADVSGLAIVTISIAANIAPVANADVASGNINTPIVIDVLANDTDGNGDALTVSTADANASANPDNTITYTQAAAGTYPVAYTVADPSGATSAGVVTVTVIDPSAQVAPVAVADTYSIGEAGILNGNVLTNDSDANGDALTAVLVTGPTNAAPGAFALNPNGSFTYRSVPDFNGEDSFTYVANDGALDSGITTVTIDVTAVNDVPVANDDTLYLNSMTTTSIAAPGVLGNDEDPDGDTLTAINGIVNAGTLALAADGSLDYTPQGGAGHVGVGTIATFTYQANDGIASSAEATVTLRRELSVRQAVCERQGNGRCHWVIEGSKSNTNRVRVRAYDATTGEVIGTDRTAGPNFQIEVGNSRINLGLGPINVQVIGDANATILDYPVTEQ